MRNEADWEAWFDNYRDYILAHARQAETAGADMFCVGRELDRTVLRREADWRELIRRRSAGVYHGPLTYSANFDTYRASGSGMPLDFIGVSAYFSLSDAARPEPCGAGAGLGPGSSPLSPRCRGASIGPCC